MTYRVIKKFGHDLGLSCCFRQPNAKSHCSRLHGYALAFEITFASNELDENNWVVDFGSLAKVKKFLVSTFDHTTVISSKDPELETFRALNSKGLIDLRILENVGCEAFAKHVYEFTRSWLSLHTVDDVRHVWVESVKVSEHGANSAVYQGVTA